MTDHKANGLTQKELSLLILEGDKSMKESTNYTRKLIKKYLEQN